MMYPVRQEIWEKELDMKNNANLIVMLTEHDQTVMNAHEIFNQCKDSDALYWGFKEQPLPIDEMKELFKLMKECGKTTVLEIVAYTEKECMAGAKKAAECNCDILMGTLFFDSVNEFCKKHSIKYMPFIGNVSERPSILEGEINSIIKQAKEYLKKGVYGLDLLSYRYTGDVNELNEKIFAEIDAPICIAGSINSMERLDAVKKLSPWGFTIGSAFFQNKFGNNFPDQINTVCQYINE